MKSRSKYSVLLLNLMVAVAVSLVVNFSYLLLLIVDQRSEPYGREERIIPRSEAGVLRIHPDGYGYLVYPAGDSVYCPSSHVRRLSLADGDSIVADLRTARRAGGHPILAKVLTRNGEEFDYSTAFSRPSETLEFILQLLYYVVLSFILLSLLTVARRNYSMRYFLRGCVWCLIVAAGLYLVAPVADWHSGRIHLNFMSGRMFDYLLLLKCSFAVAVSMLYARIYQLISQRQTIVLENEQLKNENLTTRYNMLVGQINPHFFFNSLNSLSMLVREGESERALSYIDRLSYTFRYIIQNGQSTLMTLEEELRFVEAYAYLFEVRYADKLFFDLEIDPRYRNWLLPALSLQPLMGNAVKHNAITRNRPLHVTIRTRDGRLEVSNPIVPKMEAEPSTGIGLENLRSRWRLVAGCDIEVRDDGETFTVSLPLRKPDENR